MGCSLRRPAAIHGICAKRDSIAFASTTFIARIIQNWVSVLGVPWFGFDGNLNMSTLFEAHIITVFVGQSVVNPEVSIVLVGSLNSNLCFFLLARSWKRDNFFDDSGHSDTRL